MNIFSSWRTTTFILVLLGLAYYPTPRRWWYNKLKRFFALCSSARPKAVHGKIKSPHQEHAKDDSAEHKADQPTSNLKHNNDTQDDKGEHCTIDIPSPNNDNTKDREQTPDEKQVLDKREQHLIDPANQIHKEHEISIPSTQTLAPEGNRDKRKLSSYNAQTEENDPKVPKLQTYPLALSNVGSTCYLNAGLQVLFCAQSLWEGDGVLFNLISDFFEGKLDTSTFVNRLESILDIGNLRECNDTRRVICTLINKLAEEDAASISGFEFTKLAKLYTCTCGRQETIHPRGPPNCYYQYIDGTSKKLSERLEQTLTRSKRKTCAMCSRTNQQEHVMYQAYPIVALLCTASSPGVTVARHITIENQEYHLIGYSLVGGGHAVAVVRHANKWYLCDDSRIDEIEATKAPQIAEQWRGEAILLAYQRQ